MVSNERNLVALGHILQRTRGKLRTLTLATRRRFVSRFPWAWWYRNAGDRRLTPRVRSDRTSKSPQGEVARRNSTCRALGVRLSEVDVAEQFHQAGWRS